MSLAIDDKNEDQEAYQALSIFCQKYDPVSAEESTEHFTSREIQSIIFNHTGIKIELDELHNLMRDMHFHYQLEDGEFIWLCRKSQ